MRKFPQIGLLWVLALADLARAAPPLQAQPETSETALARELFKSGVEHYEAGEFAEALLDFERAYTLKPHPLVQVNIANCYDKLNQGANALEHFDAFLQSSEGTPAQRDEVRAAVARLSKTAARLSLRATPPGAQGVIDGKKTAQPLQWLSAGRHRVDVTAEGYEPAVRVVEMRPGETLELEVNLVPQAAPLQTAQLPAAALFEGATPPSSPAPRPTADDLPQPVAEAAQAQRTAPLAVRSATTHSGLPANVWIAGGATFGLGIIAVVTGQLALAANREFDTNLSALRNTALTENQRAGAWARGVDAADRADALAAVTDILLTFTFVGVGLTTYFYLADRDESERKRMRVALQTDSKSGQLQLRGSF